MDVSTDTVAVGAHPPDLPLGHAEAGQWQAEASEDPEFRRPGCPTDALHRPPGRRAEAGAGETWRPEQHGRRHLELAQT